MRKAFYAIPLAAVAVFATPAIAQPVYTPYGYEAYAYAPPAPYPWPVPWVAGAAVGTGVAIGAYNGAFGAGLAGAGIGSAVVGGTAAIGAVALTDALLQPCHGFAAVFGLNHGACVNGQYFGYAPPPPR